MAGPLHTRRLRAAPSPSRRGQELLVLSDLKNYGIATTVCALSRNDISLFMQVFCFLTSYARSIQSAMTKVNTFYVSFLFFYCILRKSVL